MFEGLEASGVQINLWFQQFQTDWLNGLAHVLDFANDELIYILLFGLLYWVISKQLGARVLLALVVVSVATYALKDILARPRPYEISDSVVALFTEETYGLPSGHVSFSLVLWGVVALWTRKRWAMIALAVYVTIQGLGRIYAGVHFAHDVVVGALLGALILVIYARYADRIGTGWQTSPPAQRLALILIVTGAIMALAFILPTRAPQGYLTTAGLWLGGSLGMWAEGQRVRFTPHEATLRRGIQLVFGLVLSMAFLLGLDVAFDAIAETGLLANLLRVIRYAIVTFTALAIVPEISIRLGLMARQTESTTPQNK